MPVTSYRDRIKDRTGSFWSVPWSTWRPDDVFWVDDVASVREALS